MKLVLEFSNLEAQMNQLCIDHCLVAATPQDGYALHYAGSRIPVKHRRVEESDEPAPGFVWFVIHEDKLRQWKSTPEPDRAA